MAWEICRIHCIENEGIVDFRLTDFRLGDPVSSGEREWLFNKFLIELFYKFGVLKILVIRTIF